MTELAYHDPDADGAARAAQIAAISVTVTEALVRLQQERTTQRAFDDERTAAAARAEREASHAAARVAWTPALNDRWLQRADVPQIFGAWAPAAGWAPSDPDANDAASRAEERLAELHPEAMHRYARARAEGFDPGAAMDQAAPAFATSHQVEQPTPQRELTASSRVVAGHFIPPTPAAHQSPSRRR